MRAPSAAKVRIKIPIFIPSLSVLTWQLSGLIEEVTVDWGEKCHISVRFSRSAQEFMPALVGFVRQKCEIQVFSYHSQD